MDKAREILTRGVEEVLPSKDGLSNLMEKKKIRVYLGIDPTGTKLHLGHSIPLRKLQQFADLGHEAILLMGTGTVLAGDPSQRDSARPKISMEEIEENIKTWKSQVENIIDFSKVKIKYNGEWLVNLDLPKILEIASNVSAFQLIKREMFQRRNDRGDTVWTHEILYPLLQGYDSVAMDVDLEIGGTDQTFNMLIGRELQKKMNNKEKYVLTVPMILGTDGKPMSKTSNNCIWLSDTSEDMFAKIMSIPDDQIESYFMLLTDIAKGDIDIANPMQAKKKLAYEIVKNFHGADEAKKAQEHFEKTVQRKQLIPVFENQNIPTWPRPTAVSGPTIVEPLLETNTVKSKSEVKRLVEQGGTAIITRDGEEKPITNIETQLPNEEIVIKVGKRKFVRVKSS